VLLVMVASGFDKSVIPRGIAAEGAYPGFFRGGAQNGTQGFLF